VNDLDECAVQMAQALEAGWPDADLVRLMAQSVEEFSALRTDEARHAFLREPRSTGRIRWDAALAGLAVHMCRLADLDSAPSWTRADTRFCPTFFWVGLPEGSSLRAYVFQRTPAYFKSRGVMLDQANLVSV